MKLKNGGSGRRFCFLPFSLHILAVADFHWRI